MRVLDGPLSSWTSEEAPTAVTIGVLDGVHLGHRALIGALDSDLVRAVLTFDPHPVEVLRPGTHPRLITTIGERTELLESAGVEVVGVLDLGEIRDQSADDFVSRVLVDLMSVSQVVVGADFRFGKDRSGDIDLLRQRGSELGFRVDVVDLVASEDEVVSSSRIRGLVEQGRVAEAARLLGSRFAIENVVVHGDARGRQIGFPTANLRPPERKLVPAHGIYACLATVGTRTHHAAVNVGVRPTFGGEELLIEAFLLDFDGDLYDEQMRVEFVDYIRPELAFESVEGLVAHMHDDVSRVRSILARAGTSM